MTMVTGSPELWIQWFNHMKSSRKPNADGGYIQNDDTIKRNIFQSLLGENLHGQHELRHWNMQSSGQSKFWDGRSGIKNARWVSWKTWSENQCQLITNKYDISQPQNPSSVLDKNHGRWQIVWSQTQWQRLSGLRCPGDAEMGSYQKRIRNSISGSWCDIYAHRHGIETRMVCHGNKNS